MITDCKGLSILKSTSKELIMMDDAKNKYHYRQVEVSNFALLQYLRQRTFICHPSIIRLRKVYKSPDRSIQNQKQLPKTLENQKFSQQTAVEKEGQRIRVGLLTEYYSMKLPIFLKNCRQSIDHDQIINTFEPILQVIEHLIAHGHFLRQLSTENIVITQEEEVKYMDSCLAKQVINIDQTEKLSESKIYQKLAEIIFDSLFPCERTRSWKSRVRLAKTQLSKENYAFFIKIYQRSLINVIDPMKTLKIKKVNNKSKVTKGIKVSPLHSKENQIIQQ